MKKICLTLAAIGMAAVLGAAGAPDTNRLDALEKQLQDAQAAFERTVREHQQLMESLRRQIEAMRAAQTGRTNIELPPSTIGQGSKGEPASPAGTAAASTAEKSGWTPSSPIRLQRGSAYMDIGMVTTLALGGSTAKDIEGGLQLGGHDPNQRGFTLQGMELNFAGAVDPYFRGNANVVFMLDSAGESHVELEEAWLETVSLPGRLKLRAGQYLAEFGRQNPTHPHTWGFVDTPLVLGRFFGPDGMRGLGAQLSWIVPTPFYSELFLGVLNSHGETMYSFRFDHEDELFLGRPHQGGRVKGLDYLTFVPRYAASFDLTDNQTLLAGISGAIGPNASGSRARTFIGGVDLYWKWKSPRHHAGFPFVSWQTEAVVRRYEAGAFSNAADDLDGSGTIDPGEPDLYGDGSIRTLPREWLTDYGLYSQLLWGFKQRWVAGLRADWVASDLARYEAIWGRDPERAPRFRLSPNLTFYPSEYSKIRLQYNYDYRQRLGPDHSIWLQLEFSLGAHAAHKF